MVILLSNSETSDNVTDLKHDKAHRWTMASDSTTISDVESSEFRRTVNSTQLQLYSFTFNLQLHDSFHPRIGEPNRGGGRDTQI